MAFELRREDLSFLARAPRVHRFEARLSAPRAAVFAALSDPTGWAEWFPGVRRAWYPSAPPHGIGTIREALVAGTHWVEELIAWDSDRRWAYTVTRSSVPLASAQVECFELEDAPGGTCVRWTLGFEPRLLLRIAGPFAARQMERVFVRAMRALEQRLAGSLPRGGGPWTPIG